MSLSKTVLLTGGTGNIGLQLVTDLLDHDYRVITTSRSDEKIKQLRDKFADFIKEKTLHFIKVNLEDKNFSDQILTYLDNSGLSVQALINNARNIDYLKLNENNLTERDNWLGEFTLDVVVAYELSMALANMKNSTLENIINISSMYGIVAPTPSLYNEFEKESPINYGVAKAALIHLTKEMAVRLADKGIRVNCVSYGGVEGRANEEFIKRYRQLNPLGRMLKHDDLYGAIGFLLSDGASGVTGHNLVVDGGWTVW